ncbi:hypothetical protein IAD21_04637 [Abditibacteriota bacterium]|nr:hypothetical protein IAD21_04637 [Abditibacteriota bacterium]
MQLGFRIAVQRLLIFVKLLQFSRFGGPGLLVVGGTLLLAFAGCGGGGGGASVPTSTPSATPIATSISASCDSTTYTPNYYGLPEPGGNDTSADVYTFWRQFPISVYIPSGTDAAFRTATLAGFDQWVDATGGRATYQLVSSASNADLVVSYSPQDPNSDTLGLTTVTYNASQHYIISAKMELFFYTTSQRADANAANQSIAAHEFGHALGISTHSPFVADLMYPSLERTREVVSTRDLNTLKTIYCNNFPTRSTAKLKNEGPTKTIVIRN